MTYQCHLCDKNYVWEQDLKRHYKTKAEYMLQQQQQNNIESTYRAELKHAYTPSAASSSFSILYMYGIGTHIQWYIC
jgi:hypothetical protein